MEEISAADVGHDLFPAAAAASRSSDEYNRLVWRRTLFERVVLLVRRLPRFRGRTRALLLLYRLLRLKHLVVTTRLPLPVPYAARLDLHSWLQRVAFLTGGYEDDTTLFLSRLYASMGGRGYVLDIGANIGLISIPLALCINADVVAVEAVHDNIQALRHNLALNGLESTIAVVPIGLGDLPKTVQIQVEGNLHEGDGTGTGNILPDGSKYECVRQSIRIDTLDNLTSHGVIPRGCSVIKIDTDGYDLNVIRGARDFLRSERPVIYGEFSAHCLRWHQQSIVDVIQEARELRYSVWPRVPKTWTFSCHTDIDRFAFDLLLVPDERNADVSWCLATDDGISSRNSLTAR